MNETSLSEPPSDTGRMPVPLTEATVSIDGMTCASCVAHVEKAARAVPGVRDARVNLARGRASVNFDPAVTDAQHIADAIARTGYAAKPEQTGAAAADEEGKRLQRQKGEARDWFRRALIGVILWLPLEATHWLMQLAGGHAHHIPAQSTWMGWATLLASTIAMVCVGGSFYRSALAALRRRTSNMDTLISMGATVAWGYSLIYFVGGLLGQWPAPTSNDLFFMEASGLLALISLGHWLESRARQSAGSAIRELLELAPSTALLLSEENDDAGKEEGVGEGESGRGGDQLGRSPRISPSPTLPLSPSSFPSVRSLPASPRLRVSASGPKEVSLSTLKVGDRLLVRPGDRVPIDGVVLEGESSVDESMITGESLPVTRTAGDPVIGGTLNQDGRLIIRVSKTGRQTALAQIVALVERAQSTKPPVQRLADQISAIFVPSVLAIALITGVGWYLWGHHLGWSSGQTWAHIARAVCSVLIIACPCALGLAVPATVMVATGMGARRGILIRDVDALQKAEKIDTVVLDKTGTITQGKPIVQEVIATDAMDGDEVLRLAASAEQFSSHPLAKAVVAAARERGLKLAKVEGFSSEAGAGVLAETGRVTVVVGNENFLRHHGAKDLGEKTSAGAQGGTFVHVGRKNAADGFERLGTIVVADQLKTDSVEAIAALHDANLGTILLTGDNRTAAENVARQVGIKDIKAEVKPGEKAAVVRELMKGGKTVAMVGDGINDAPALAAADLGIAVGGGSDIAKEAGDIVLVSGSLIGVAAAIRLSRATMRKIRQNLFLAFIYNVIAIPLAAFGLLHPLVAAAAMALSDVTVIGNALLLRREKMD